MLITDLPYGMFCRVATVQEWSELQGVVGDPKSTQQLWAPIAGRYGRTRGGRKVKIVPQDNSDYPFTVPIMDRRLGYYDAWKRDGRSSGYGVTDRDDLVAEWSDPFTSSDLKVLEVGDQIDLRLTLRESQIYGSPVVSLPFCGQVVPVKDIDPKLIVKRIPKPRPIEAGCRVRSRSNASDLVRDWTVIHVHHGRAWVENRDLFAVLLLSDLSHIEDEAA